MPSSHSICLNALVLFVATFQITTCQQWCYDLQSKVWQTTPAWWSIVGTASRAAWCQANSSAYIGLLNTLGNGSCPSSMMNGYSGVTNLLADVQALCGTCGADSDTLREFSQSYVQTDLAGCNSKLSSVLAAGSAVNTSSCLNSSAVTGMFGWMLQGQSLSLQCNPCFYTVRTNSDVIVQGCNIQSYQAYTSDTASTAAAMPLCVASSCPLSTACADSNLQPLVAGMGGSTVGFISNLTKIWLPKFTCSSVVTLVGTISLSCGVPGACRDQARKWIAAGIATYLGTPVQATMVALSFDSTQQSSPLQATYTIGLNSGDAAAVKTKMTQATAQMLTPFINASVATNFPPAGSVSVLSVTAPTMPTTTAAATMPKITEAATMPTTTAAASSMPMTTAATQPNKGIMSGCFRRMYLLGGFLQLALLILM
jgi:hypothetical protein